MVPSQRYQGISFSPRSARNAGRIIRAAKRRRARETRTHSVVETVLILGRLRVDLPQLHPLPVGSSSRPISRKAEAPPPRRRTPGTPLARCSPDKRPSQLDRGATTPTGRLGMPRRPLEQAVDARPVTCPRGGSEAHGYRYRMLKLARARCREHGSPAGLRPAGEHLWSIRRLKLGTTRPSASPSAGGTLWRARPVQPFACESSELVATPPANPPWPGALSRSTQSKASSS